MYALRWSAPQTRVHLLWHCQLRHVRRVRRDKLEPACRGLHKVLSGLETVTGLNPVAAECCNALHFECAPTATRVGGVAYSEESMGAAALRLMLGLVPLTAAVSQMRDGG